jgi:DtxR family Mn-dependent transcriptional regulator
VANESKARSDSTPVGTLSESLEDYLEIILQLQQEKRVARVRDIANRKRVSNASVSNALVRLARDGYVLHEAHEFVELTTRGEELARRVLRRHEFLIAFLRDVLQVSPQTAQADACAMEHQVSAETLERLASFYQFVCSCPNAGPSFLDAFKACCSSGKGGGPWGGLRECVPFRGGGRGAEGGATPEAAAELVALSALRPGETGVVVRLSAPSALRERLADAGVLPNVRVDMIRAGAEGNGLQVRVQGCAMDLEQREASAILVRRAGAGQ